MLGNVLLQIKTFGNGLVIFYVISEGFSFGFYQLLRKTKAQNTPTGSCKSESNIFFASK